MLTGKLPHDIMSLMTRITVLLGCMLGVLTACLMVTLAGCLVCPWCPAHRQRRRTIKHKSESAFLKSP